MNSRVAQKERLYLFLILLIGVSLRIYNLGSNALWFDEICSIFASEAFMHSISTRGLFPALSFNFVLSPAFCLVVKLWRSLGDTEFILRLLPVIFGTFSIIVIYKLGKRLFNTKVGLFSAFILSISPFHVYHSQELRMYSLIGLSSLLSVYYLIKALQERKSSYWAAYIIFNIISLYAHHMTIFILFSEVFFFLIYHKRYRDLTKKWLISHALILIFLIPWILNIFLGTRFNFETANFYLHPLENWILPPSIKSFFWTFKSFSIGFNAGRITYILATASFLSLAIYGIVKSPKTENLFLVLCLLFLPLLIPFVISQFKYCYVIRYFIPSSFFYYILVAAGLNKIKQRYSILIIIFILALTGGALKNYYANYLPGSNIQFMAAIPKMDIEGAVKYIKDNFQEGDVIGHTHKLTLASFEYYLNFKIKPNYTDYLNSKRNKQLLLSSHGEGYFLRADEYTAGFLNEDLKETDIKLLEKYKRIWLVFNQWEWPILSDAAYKLNVVGWMEKHYHRINLKEFHGISIYSYEPFNNKS